MEGEGAGGWAVGVILAGDMNNIWKLGLPGWDGSWTSLGVVVILGFTENNIQNLYIEHHHENYYLFLW